MRLAFLLGLFSFLVIILTLAFKGKFDFRSSGMNSLYIDNQTSDISMPDGTKCIHRNPKGGGYIEGQILVGLEELHQYQSIKAFSDDNPEVTILEKSENLKFGSTANICLKNLAPKEEVTKRIIDSGGKIKWQSAPGDCLEVKYPEFTGRETIENALKSYSESVILNNFTFSPYYILIKVPAGEENVFLKKIQTLPIKYSELSGCGSIVGPF
jgi:hypothetical protein